MNSMSYHDRSFFKNLTTRIRLRKTVLSMGVYLPGEMVLNILPLLVDT